MKPKLLESALAHLGDRLYSLRSQASILSGVTKKTPVTLNAILQPSTDGIQAAIDALQQVRKDMVATAEPLLNEWLLNLGAVIGEQVCFSMTDRKVVELLTAAEIAAIKATSPHSYVRSRVIELREARVIGTIAGLCLDRGSRVVGVELDQTTILHTTESSRERMLFDPGVNIDYAKEGNYRNKIRLDIGMRSVVIGVPIRRTEFLDLAMIKP